MSEAPTLRGTVTLGLAVAVVVALCLMAAGGLAVTASVAVLMPHLGLAGALLAVAGGLVAVAVLAVLVLRARVRRLQARRAALGGVIEIALLLLPRKRLAELEVWLAAGLAVGVSLSGLIRRKG